MTVAVAEAQDLYVKKLKNGYTLVVKERDDTQTVSVQVWFGIGSIYEKDNERGISHFLEHMLFNGTKYTAPGEIEFEVEKKGGMINAATSFDYTFYYIEIANIFWQDALRYLYYMTTAPTLSDKMVEKEKPIVLEELNRHLDNPKSLLWDTFNELAYKKSNYKHPIIGYRETLQNFAGELVRNYFYTHYTPSVATIIVVGNVNKEEVEKAVEETFGSVKGQEYHPPSVPVEDPQREVISKTLKKPQVTRAYSVIGWQAPSIRDKRAIAFMILEDILFGGKSSIMYQQLKETGIVQGVSGGYMPHLGTGQFLIYLTTDTNKRDIAKEKVFDILNRFRKEGIPQDLFEESKKRIINREIFAREEVSEEAERIGYALAVAGNLDYELKFTEMVKAVKKEEVEQILANQLGNDNYTEVILLPEN
ncbi:MAG: pitrilysin family protein [Hydrogenothermaceae bacterium]